MTPKQIDSFCGTLPAATRTVQWEGVTVFKVGGKMFLIVSLDAETMEGCAFKCSPADYERLTAEVDGIIPARYNLFKAHWVQLEDPDALSPAQLTRQIQLAYNLIRSALPKKIQATLAAPPANR